MANQSFLSCLRRVNTMATYDEEMDKLVENYRKFTRNYQLEYIEAQRANFHGLGKAGVEYFEKTSLEQSLPTSCTAPACMTSTCATQTSPLQPRASRSSKMKSSRPLKRKSSRIHDKQRQRRQRHHRRRRHTPLPCRVFGAKQPPISTVTV